DLRVLQCRAPRRNRADDAGVRRPGAARRHPPDPAHHQARRRGDGSRAALCAPPAGRRHQERGMNDAARILGVDDNEMNRDMLARRLLRQGHAVETAIHGREALSMLQAGAYDLVLLDIMMPEMNGYELLEHLRGDPAFQHLPVILISALDD